jgi:hypothetical protein
MFFRFEEEFFNKEGRLFTNLATYDAAKPLKLESFIRRKESNGVLTLLSREDISIFDRVL